MRLSETRVGRTRPRVGGRAFTDELAAEDAAVPDGSELYSRLMSMATMVVIDE